MDIRTDGGDQEVMQKGDGDHTAVINLFGSEHTDVSLTQQGNTNQSYSMTQTCQTSGGCTMVWHLLLQPQDKLLAISI